MKKNFIIINLISIATIQANNLFNDDACRTSRTFLYYRPAYNNLAATRNLYNNVINYKQGPNLAAFQITGIFQESLLSQRSVSGYFFPNCSNRIIIKGDLTENSHIRNVRAEWVNLPSNYNGELCINPKQKQATIVFDFNQNICKYLDIEIFKYSWFGLFIPFQYVQNNLQLNEVIKNTDLVTEPGQPKTAIEAFNQPTWNFAKLYKGTKSKAGIAEVRLIFGTTFPTDRDFLLTTTSFVVLPTTRKHKPTHLFKPIIGTNNHVGLGTSVRFDLPLYDKECNSLKYHAFFAAEIIYFFPNKQYRTVDLKDPSGVTAYGADLPRINRQWSRYLLLRLHGEDRVFPGVNILTQKFHVDPYSTLDLTTGIKACFGGLYAEIGYNIWARNRERLKIRYPKCETAPFDFQLFGIAGKEPGTSSCASTICNQAADDEVFHCIRKQDLSLASATYPGGSTHRFHILLGILNPPCNKFFGSIGAFYEFPHSNNTVFKNWGIWGQVGSSF